MLLQKYEDTFKELVQQYQLTDEQLRFTGLPEQPIIISRTNLFIHPILGIDGGLLTTFFVLDEKKDVALYTTNTKAILLRTFSTDHRYQGKGYAKKALQQLPHFVSENFPKANELILAVNQKNLPAQKLYERAGFQYSDKSVIGEAGPLYVMSLKLDLLKEGTVNEEQK